MQTFDPLTFAEHLLAEAQNNIILLLLGVAGALMVWVAFKKIRS